MPLSDPAAENPWQWRFAVATLVVAGVLAWANSFGGPFVFDDRPAILANASLTGWRTVLSPPHDGGTVAGRPLVNLTLAIDHALHGTRVAGYHATNLLIHLLAGLTLFGLVRRTLLLPRTRETNRSAERSPANATTIALIAALLWLVHPLQTAAVTYVIQRAETLMALCFLLTLYGFVRGRLIVSVLACLVGMAAKEVMVVAPVVVLLFDRTFVSGSFRAALGARPRYYGALAATWILLGFLVIGNPGRSGTAGFATSIGPMSYAATQAGAIVRYVGLAVWPQRLVFDYGTSLAPLATVWPQVVAVVALLIAVAVALARWPRAGFLGAVFFLVLAPSSSFVPIATQTMAEHRMYLPLAALAVGVALGLERGLRRAAFGVALVLAIGLGVATARRNMIYQDAASLWADTVRHRPENPRAHNNLAIVLAQQGKSAEAVREYQKARDLAPADGEIRNNLGNALDTVGRSAEALAEYAEAARLKPNAQPIRVNLARALAQANRPVDAIVEYESAAKLGPLDADALAGFGATLLRVGRAAEGVARCEEALRLDSRHAAAHYQLGAGLARDRKYAPAAVHFRAVLAAEPQHLAARVNLGNVLLLTNHAKDAIAEYEIALRLKPDDPQIQANLARARQLARVGQ